MSSYVLKIFDQYDCTLLKGTAITPVLTHLSKLVSGQKFVSARISEGRLLAHWRKSW